MPHVVVITGATAGVGRATAHAFAERGAALGLIARGEEKLDATREELERRGARVVTVAADVSDAADVQAAALTFEQELGPIDVWVNNAMTAVLARVRDTSPEEFRRVLDVNFLGVVHGTLAALDRMRTRDAGTIVQVGSALSYRGIPLQATYCSSKFAIRGFTESLRCELLNERSGVRVTMVQLPGLNTPQFEWVRTRLPWHPRPVAPVFQPEVAADAIVWAAQHAPREAQVGASTVATILGQKVWPGLLDRYLARTNIKGQQLDGVPPTGQDYLDKPVTADHGTHGRFGEESKSRSPQWWLRTHPGAVASSVAGLAGLAAYVARSR